jgi:hypothetical protein
VNYLLDTTAVVARPLAGCALEKIGTPIASYDLLIAGRALRRGLTVVTANTSEFSRVSGELGGVDEVVIIRELI